MMYTGHPDAWGLIPQFLDPNDDRDAVTQIDANYGHGGGWNDTVSEYELEPDGVGEYELLFTVDGDSPPLHEQGRTYMRDETIVLFPYSWVAVIQPDGSSRVARID